MGVLYSSNINEYLNDKFELNTGLLGLAEGTG